MNLVLGVLAVLALAALGLVAFTARTARRVVSVLPPMGRFVDLPGARLHLVERGQGSAVLLVHGLAGTLGNFTYGLVDALAAQHRVVAVDRPGAGYSVRASGAACTPQAQADVLAALIETLQLGRPLVMGHSLGGAVALALALRHPQSVAGLALVAPLTHVPEGVPPAFAGLAITQGWLRTLVAWTLAVPAMIAKRDLLLGLVFGPEPVPGDFDIRGGALLGLRPSHFIAASADLSAVPESLPELQEHYAQLRLPVCVLFGRGDRILSPRAQGEALAALVPGAQFTLVDGGHMLPVTQPALTARFVHEAALRAAALAMPRTGA